jgi:hypothetical protein
VLVDGGPGFCRCLETNDVHEHIGGENVEDTSKHLLFMRDLGGVLRVLNHDLLLVDVLSLQEFLWRLL